MPISRAASGSSDVARKARPSLVYLMNRASPPSTAIAVSSVMSGIQPMLIVSLILIVAVFERADVEALRVGGVLLEQRVLDDDAEAERGDDLKRRIDADDAIEHEALQDVTDHQCAGHDDRRAWSAD